MTYVKSGEYPFISILEVKDEAVDYKPFVELAQPPGYEVVTSDLIEQRDILLREIERLNGQIVSITMTLKERDIRIRDLKREIEMLNGWKA